MPQWKFLLSERERWELVNYVRDILALPAKGREPDESDTPKKYNNLKFPKGTSYERGREVYMMRCALCHGYGGQGEGLDGDNLDPAPANFTDPDVRNMGTMGHDAPAMDKQNMPAMKGNNMAMTGGSDMTMTGEHDTPATGGNDTPTKDKQMDGRGASSMGHDMSAMGDGHWFWRVTEGVRNTAMPIWGLLLSEQERWDVIKYVQDTYTFPKPPARINYAVPQEFQEITNPITESGDEAALKNSIANGAELYQTHCAGCHGTKGEGFGKFVIELNPKAGPLAKNPRIAKGGDDFIFYIVSQGINHTPMAPFEYVLSESEIWDLVNYIKTLSPASLAEN
jgi:mono/diheme cytochrome c family protein